VVLSDVRLACFQPFDDVTWQHGAQQLHGGRVCACVCGSVHEIVRVGVYVCKCDMLVHVITLCVWAGVCMLQLGTSFMSENCGSGSAARTTYHQARLKKRKSTRVLRYFIREPG
jgi:hypothetical protein